VRWLCEALRARGRRPAVLMRGYRAMPGERGDEQAMLESLLPGDVVVHAEPKRYEGGLAVLAAHPEVDRFVMDDGFQHRRLARDFDLVLVDACEPFGFGRVIPRGLLREPLGGLRRADAILITRADQATAEAIERIVARVRTVKPDVPLYRCSHAHVGLRSADGGLHSLEELAGRRFFAFAGIGNPEGFEAQLRRLPGDLCGRRWLGDHWDYSATDVAGLRDEARACGAELLVTTEKDWVKVARMIGVGADGELPVWRVELAVRFEADDEERLLGQIRARLKARRS
jgi:tetraacyldisaccharide 4'-kinase